jgi:hypothetical protein
MVVFIRSASLYLIRNGRTSILTSEYIYIFFGAFLLRGPIGIFVTWHSAAIVLKILVYESNSARKLEL